MLLSIIIFLLRLAFAQHLVVEVGKSGLTFEPNITIAVVGSEIEFQFLSEEHSVAAGDYYNPCNPANDSSFFSGKMDKGKSFTINVNGTDPIWIYCPEHTHCRNGMVGVINPPQVLIKGPSLEEFKKAAAKVSNTSYPLITQGGMVSDGSGNLTSSPTGTAPSASHSPKSTGPSAGAGNALQASTAFGVVKVFGSLFAGLLAL